MPPSTKHVVATLDRTIMVGDHFYHRLSLDDSFVSFVQSFFRNGTITNAEHHYLLANIQSFCTLWGRAMTTNNDDQGNVGRAYSRLEISDGCRPFTTLGCLWNPEHCGGDLSGHF